MPLDQYLPNPVAVMDRVQSDKEKNLDVASYGKIQTVSMCSLHYVERFAFYELSKKAFCIIQTDDYSPYANIIVYKGVVG